MAPGSEIRFVHKLMGLVPGWGGATRLIHLIGSRNALKLLCGTVKVDPEYALTIGLADDILNCVDDRSLEEANKWLSMYTKGSPAVNRALKKVILSGREQQLEDALRIEKDIFGTVWGGPDNREALSKATKHR